MTEVSGSRNLVILIIQPGNNMPRRRTPTNTIEVRLQQEREAVARLTDLALNASYESVMPPLVNNSLPTGEPTHALTSRNLTDAVDALRGQGTAPTTNTSNSDVNYYGGANLSQITTISPDLIPGTIRSTYQDMWTTTTVPQSAVYTDANGVLTWNPSATMIEKDNKPKVAKLISRKGGKLVYELNLTFKIEPC